MQIRVASASDIPEMHRVRMSVSENTLDVYGILTPELYRDHLERLGRGWVAETDSRIVGMAIVNAEEASIWALFVQPEWEGQGVGRALHDTMLTWLRSQGLSKVTLETIPKTRAESFYRSAGWQPTGRDEKGQIRLEKTLWD